MVVGGAGVVSVVRLIGAFIVVDPGKQTKDGFHHAGGRSSAVTLSGEVERKQNEGRGDTNQ